MIFVGSVVGTWIFKIAYFLFRSVLHFCPTLSFFLFIFFFLLFFFFVFVFFFSFFFFLFLSFPPRWYPLFVISIYPYLSYSFKYSSIVRSWEKPWYLPHVYWVSCSLEVLDYPGPLLMNVIPAMLVTMEATSLETRYQYLAAILNEIGKLS